MKKPSSPVLSTVALLLKLLMCLSTLAFAALCFFDGYFLTGWYPTAIDLKMGGIMMVLSAVLFIFAFLILKKKNLGSFFLIISIAVLDYGAFVYDQGLGHELGDFIVLYGIAMVFLYCVSKLIEQKL